MGGGPGRVLAPLPRPERVRSCLACPSLALLDTLVLASDNDGCVSFRPRGCYLRDPRGRISLRTQRVVPVRRKSEVLPRVHLMR